MLMVTSMLENGKMTKHLVMGNTHTPTVQCMKENGLMINKMVKVKRFGLMVHDMLDNIRMDASTGMAKYFSKMVPGIKDRLIIMTYMVMENMYSLINKNSIGPTIKNIKVTGVAIKCMERAY